jgi:hypothetical protein
MPGSILHSTSFFALSSVAIRQLIQILSVPGIAKASHTPRLAGK